MTGPALCQGGSCAPGRRRDWEEGIERRETRLEAVAIFHIQWRPGVQKTKPKLLVVVYKALVDLASAYQYGLSYASPLAHHIFFFLS